MELWGEDSARGKVADADEEWKVYKYKNREAKIAAPQAKRLVIKREGERLVSNFKESKNMLWKEMKKV